MHRTGSIENMTMPSIVAIGAQPHQILTEQSCTRWFSQATRRFAAFERALQSGSEAVPRSGSWLSPSQFMVARNDRPGRLLIFFLSPHIVTDLPEQRRRWIHSSTACNRSQTRLAFSARRLWFIHTSHIETLRAGPHWSGTLSFHSWSASTLGR
jgi:hypothetical protein